MFTSAYVVILNFCSEFPQTSHRSCKRICKFSMRWQVRGFYGSYIFYIFGPKNDTQIRYFSRLLLARKIVYLAFGDSLLYLWDLYHCWSRH